MKRTKSAGRALALVAGVALATSVLAQAPAPDGKAAVPAKPAKAAAPAKKAPPAAKAAPVPEFKLVLEPRAMELLKATSARLAAARTMSFTAVASYEYPSRLGPPIVYTVRYDVAMQRPDKLRVVVPGDGPASEFYFDGSTMMAYAPAENLVAVADAPGTIDTALKQAYQTAAIYYPFTDLVVADPYAALTDGARLAFVVGPSGHVGGTKTDMVVWASDDVFLQIWIGADDKLPRRVRAIFREDPMALRHEVEFSNWQLDAPIAADAFASAKAQGAQRMAFANPAPSAPAGVKPIVKDVAGAPAKAK
ncbi:MAG: DUF2092 domain-containing protein [Burkholderiales bacterium]